MAENEREENYAKVIEFPNEVRVYGNISHVYIEGKDRHSTLIIDQNKTSPSESCNRKEKSTKEPILIVPIKKNKSELEFVKVPLQKLSKHPKGEKVGFISCPKVILDDDNPSADHIPQYVIDAKDFPNKDESKKLNNEYNTCFIFHQASPLRKDVIPNLPIADLFHFQRCKSKEIKPVETRDELTQVSDSLEELFKPLDRKSEIKPASKEEVKEMSNSRREVALPASKDAIIQVPTASSSPRGSSNKDKETNAKNSRSYLHYLITPKKDTH